MLQIVKWSPNERVDIPDQRAQGELLLLDQTRQSRVATLPTGRNVGVANTECRIFDEFGLGTIVTTTCRINGGSGLFKILWEGQLYLGLLVGECGDDYKVIDLVGQANGDYAVYVRALYYDTDPGNRIFWSQPLAAERVANVNTRRTMTWEYVTQAWSAAPPAGGDWVLVGKIVVLDPGGAPGTISAVQDYRHFFYEGDATTGAGQWAAEWGGGTDRNANRALYGVKDWHRAWQALRTQIKTIFGATWEWYEIPDPDLTDLAVEHDTDGTHKQVHAELVQLNADTGGPTDDTWTDDTNFDATFRRRRFVAADHADNGIVEFLIADASTHWKLQGHPRGFGAVLSNNDFFEICLGPTNLNRRWGMRSTVVDVATNEASHSWGRLDGTPEMRLDVNAGLGTGLHLTETDGEYFAKSRTVNIRCCASWEVEYVAGWPSWHPDRNGVNGLVGQFCTNGHASEPIFATINEWPEGMTLNSAILHVALSGIGVPATPMTVTLERHTWDPSGATHAVTVLNAVTKNTYTEDYALTCAGAGPAWQNWTHEADRLVVRVSPADGAALTDNWVYDVILNCTFERATKWPV